MTPPGRISREKSTFSSTTLLLPGVSRLTSLSKTSLVLAMVLPKGNCQP